MKAPTLKRKLCVFGDDGAKTVTIDKITFVLSPTHALVPRERLDTARLAEARRCLAEAHGARLDRVSYRRCLVWDEAMPSLSVQQYVADWLPGDRRRSVAQIVAANPLRALAREYEEQGRTPRRLRWDPDNVVLPHCVAPAEVSQAVFSFMRELSTTRVDAYCAAYEALVGRPLPRDQVRVSVPEIELTWDRTCEVAGYAPDAFWKPWRVRLNGATFHAHGPYITAAAAKGERYKLYAKSPRVLRFEVRLSRARIRRLLGHSLDPLDPIGFEADIRRLAGRMYRRVQDIQEHVVPEHVVDPSGLIRALVKRRAPHVVRVLEAFLVGGCFDKKADDESAGRVLRALRSENLVALLPHGKGQWGMQGDLEVLMRHVWFRTLSLGSS